MNNKNITVILAFITIPILTFYIIKNLKNTNTKLNIETIIKDLYQFLNLYFLHRFIKKNIKIFLILIFTPQYKLFLFNMLRES